MRSLAGTLVLFDLDGTLLDSAPDIADALDRALRGAGFEAPGEHVVRGYIGDGAARLVHRAMTGARDGEAPPDRFQPVFDAFLSHYETRLYCLTRPYPHVTETLEGLRARGCSLGCVTNKPDRFTRPLLAAAGLDAFFSIVLSGDSLARRKPHPEPILHACAHLRTAAVDAAMVGDSVNDIAAARGAGIGAVGVTYGYSGATTLAESGAHALVRSMSELPGALERVLDRDGARAPATGPGSCDNPPLS